MNFGVILPTFGIGADRASILETSRAAERLGFDSVWLTDHIALPATDAARFGHIYEAISTLAYLAGTTQRIGLGTSVLILPQRNPVEIAKQIATIDDLSNGRVMLAVGVGWSRGEYANLGYNFHNRGSRMNEALKVLRTLWSRATPISFHGAYYHFENAVVSPSPVQNGGPRVWVGGNSPAALRRAVSLGDGWHPNAHSPSALRTALKSVESELKDRDFEVCPRIHLDFNQVDLSEQVLHGTSQQVVRQIKAYQAAGMTGAVIDFDAESTPARLRAMEKFAGEVVPQFR